VRSRRRRASHEVVITFLELSALEQLRPAPPPRLPDVRIGRIDPPNGAVDRWFYERVGAGHEWTDLLGRSRAQWQAWAERHETWVVTVRGERAGFYELDVRPDAAKIAYFGLLPAFHGAGLGGHLLTHALRRALQLAPRVWLTTNTLDAPAALPNYEARGMRAYRRESRRV
jgi:GNAT superfamily N-acetyltransferase